MKRDMKQAQLVSPARGRALPLQPRLPLAHWGQSLGPSPRQESYPVGNREERKGRAEQRKWRRQALGAGVLLGGEQWGSQVFWLGWKLCLYRCRPSRGSHALAKFLLFPRVSEWSTAGDRSPRYPLSHLSRRATSPLPCLLAPAALPWQD